MEETLQKKHNYPGYPDHKKEHDGFIAELQKLEKQLQLEGASFPLVIQTNQTMVNWLIKHINARDKEMALFLRSNSYGNLGSVFAQAPHLSAPAGDEEEDKAVEGGQLPLVHRRKEGSAALKLPMEFEIGHRHHAAAEEGGEAGAHPEHDRHPADQFDDPAKPEQRKHGWL
jgi:hypothetical protein